MLEDRFLQVRLLDQQCAMMLRFAPIKTTEHTREVPRAMVALAIHILQFLQYPYQRRFCGMYGWEANFTVANKISGFPAGNESCDWREFPNGFPIQT
mmetsp:Transcript_20613/g.28934  ORF Transcript_20613/g.28934 Transcript_20613/m.28934 type:complete len:97 (+) Transcript_20613:328-618(+)